jgi:hypothetical protein
VVEDFDTGFAMERNEYRASSGRVYAEAGGFTYLFENDYIGSREPVYEALLAPEEDSMALLEAGGPDDACLLAIRKANPEERSAVYLDGRRYRLKWAKDEPMRFRIFHLPPGEHEIRVKPPPGLLSVLDYTGKLEKSIVCNGGDSIFADVSVTMESGGSWARSELKGEIRRLRIPEAFFGSRAMLFQGGEWVGLPPVARPVGPRPAPDREPAQR